MAQVFSQGDDTRYTTGAIIAVTQDSDSQYTCTQVVGQDRIPKAPEGVDAIIPFDWSFGPIRVWGQINTDSFSIQFQISVLGITIGSFSGNLKDGVCVNINLALAKGKVCLVLKNGNELWVTYDIKILFDGEFKGEKKIIGW